MSKRNWYLSVASVLMGGILAAVIGAAPAYAQHRAAAEVAAIPPPTCIVPNVVNASTQVAQIILTISFLDHKTVGRGPVVLDQSPDAGSVIRCYSTVILTTV